MQRQPVCGELLIFPESAIRHTHVAVVLLHSIELV